MMRPALGALITWSVLAFAFLGCNSILDNQPASLVVTDEAGASPEPGSDALPNAQPNADGASGTGTTPDAGDKPSTNCPAGQQMCFGTCVSLTDPFYGCGDQTCSPCSAGHSTMGCQGRKCVVTACDPGYADCNASSADGCETDLSKATSCGACNAVCGVAAPLCTPSGATFQCTNGCTPAAPLSCGAECVDPNTSPTHCGGCTIACPLVVGGTPTCTAGACSFTCQPLFHACTGKCVGAADPASCGPTCVACPVPAGGVATCVADTCGIKCNATFHACAGKCVADSDPTACGAACTVCPVPTNAAAATCVGGACSITPCAAGLGNCDGNAANGCEASLASDPANCGVCGRACPPAMSCVLGACM